MTNSQTHHNEDEIDLRELFSIINERKVFITIFTFFVTIVSIVYVMIKNPIPIYSGNMLLEIGEVKTNNPNQTYFDNTLNLKSVVEKEFDVTIDIPKTNANSIIIITAENEDKNSIKQSLKNVKGFILTRHNEKTKLYDNYIMTKQIGEIDIQSEPVNKPKKQLIVAIAFISGLILSLFLALMLEFIQTAKNKRADAKTTL